MNRETQEKEIIEEQIIDMLHQTKNNADSTRTSPKENPEFDSEIRILGRKISSERIDVAEKTISTLLPENFLPMRWEVEKKHWSEIALTNTEEQA